MIQNLIELDDYRKIELLRLDIGRLRECAVWGAINAPRSEETIFANALLNHRLNDRKEMPA